MRASFLLGVVAVIAVDSITANAQKIEQPEIIQALFVSPTVFPQEKGAVQLTTAASWLGEAAQGAVMGDLEIEVGITNRWQIEISGTRRLHNARNTIPNEGLLGGAGIATQYSWMGLGSRKSTHLTIGIQGGVSGHIDNANSRDIEPFVIAAHDVNDWLHLSGSFGYGISTPTEHGKNVWGLEREEEQNVSAAAVVRFKQFRFTHEFTASFYEGESVSAWTPGIVFKPLAAFEFGVARPIKIGSEGLAKRLIVQLMLEF